MNFIWYGTNFSSTSPTILNNFMNSINASSWWNIAREYCPSNSCPCNQEVGNIFLGDQVNITTYTHGTNISNVDILAIVANQVQKPFGGKSQRDIYFVLTDGNTNVYDNSGGAFCTDYCGWHTYDNTTIIPGLNMLYGFIGSANRCPQDCSYFSNTTDTPNGNLEMDSMVNVIAHELAEAATDPLLNAWLDAGGNEVGDKCFMTFTGQSVSTPLWNQDFGGYKFLIQDLWSLRLQGCVPNATFPSVSATACAFYSHSQSHHPSKAYKPVKGLNLDTSSHVNDAIAIGLAVAFLSAVFICYCVFHQHAKKRRGMGDGMEMRDKI